MHHAHTMHHAGRRAWYVQGTDTTVQELGAEGAEHSGVLTGTGGHTSRGQVGTPHRDRWAHLTGTGGHTSQGQVGTPLRLWLFQPNQVPPIIRPIKSDLMPTY